MEVYRAWGWRGFAELRGMYAFAIWDRQRSTGLLVRDPLGIKPLFIHRQADGGFVFAAGFLSSSSESLSMTMHSTSLAVVDC